MFIESIVNKIKEESLICRLFDFEIIDRASLSMPVFDHMNEIKLKVESHDNSADGEGLDEIVQEWFAETFGNVIDMAVIGREMTSISSKYLRNYLGFSFAKVNRLDMSSTSLYGISDSDNLGLIVNNDTYRMIDRGFIESNTVIYLSEWIETSLILAGDFSKGKVSVLREVDVSSDMKEDYMNDSIRSVEHTCKGYFRVDAPLENFNVYVL